jgi:hypothetical protein
MAPRSAILAFLGVLLATAGTFHLGGDVAGLFVLAASLTPALLVDDCRRDRRVALVFLLVVTAHAGVTFVNATVGSTLGADADAAGFHDAAIGISQAPELDFSSAIGSRFYTHYLGFIYTLFGPSLLLGGALSGLAFSLSMVVLLRIMRVLETPRRAGVLALYGLLPSALMFSSVPLREAYQQLFVLLLVYAGLRMRERRLRWGLAVAAAATALAVWHEGMPLMAGFFGISIVTWSAGTGHGIGLPWRRVLGLGVAAAVIFFIVGQSGVFAPSLEAVSKGEAFEFADRYRNKGASVAGRTTYGVRLDPNSAAGLVTTVPVVFAEYMLAPLPWQIDNALDVEAFAECLLRVALVVGAVSAWRHATGVRRERMALLLWLFFAMELTWSLGTVNWGTAIRHHLPALGLIIVPGGPAVINAASRLLRTLVFRPQRAA